MRIEFDMLNAPIDWFIALGSNIGDSRGQLRRARRALAEHGELIASSSIYESAPMYELDQPRFLNAVVHLRTELGGPALLGVLRAIEQANGRDRDPARRYGPRTIDLDIVAGIRDDEEVVYDTDELSVPHPRMDERAFVLEPLRELAPTWVHPRLALSVEDMLSALGDASSLAVAYQPSEWE